MFPILLLVGNVSADTGLPPTATTGSVSSITSNSATLNGTVASNGTGSSSSDTAVSFQFGLSNSYGSTVTGSPAVVFSGSGETNISVSAEVNLLPDTEYHFRIVATNSFGTTYGDDGVFTTLALTPEISVKGNGNTIADGDTTPSTVDLTDFGSTLVSGGFVAKSFTIQNSGTGALQLNGNPIVSISGTHASDFAVTVQPSSSSIAAGSSASFTVKFDPSAVGTRTATVSIANDDSDENPYDFAIQGIGTVASSPTVTTDTANSVVAYTATLNGTVNGNGLATTVSFEYGITLAYGSTVSFGALDDRQLLVDQSVSKSISGLSENTTYHYRVVATNSSGTTTGADQNFTTGPAVPEIDILNGVINILDGLSTSDFGTTGITVGTIDKTYTIRNLGTGNLVLSGSPVVSVSGASSGDFAVTTQPPLTTLSPGDSTTFTVRFDPSATGIRVASISIDNNDSDENPFNFTIYGTGITDPTGPNATTSAATSVSISAATLNGVVNDLSANTTVTFEYGETNSYGSIINATPNTVAGGTGSTSVSANITGLSPNTEYHFRVVGSNSYGTTNGSDLFFTTLSAAAVDLNISDVALIYTENDSATQVDSTASLTGGGEVEWSNSDLTVQITANSEAADELSIPDNLVGDINTLGTDLRSGSTVIGTLSAAEGTVTGSSQLTINFNDNGNITYVQQVIQAISYRNTSDVPSSSDRTVTFVATNSFSLADTDTRIIEVQAENDTPTLPTNLGLTLNEGATATITTAKLSASDDDNSDTQLTFTVTTSPVHGRLENTDNTGVAAASFTQENLMDGKMQYVHDDSDTISDSFTFTLSDGTANLTNNTFNISVNPMADLPVATTDAASSVVGDGAVLNGTVDDRDGETTVLFEYGLDNTYGSSVFADQSPIASGTGSTSVSTSLSGLLSDTTYHYRVVATNSAGTTEGGDQDFTTPIFIPSTQSNNIDFSSTDFTSTTASWTRGSGAKCVVFIKVASSGMADPVNGTTYMASTTFGSGSQIGSSGWYCVYNGTGTSVQVTGLTLNTTYRLQVIEYNGPSGSELYNKNTAANNPANVSSLHVDIAIFGNSVSIQSGSLSPSLSNDTDFGSIDLNGGTKTVTFYIRNEGTGELSLTGSPLVSLSGNHASDFSVSQPSVSTLAGGASTTFKVAFDPSAEGSREAVVSVASNDADENPYTFGILGHGVPAKPSVTTEPATSVTYSQARLNGSVNDNGGDTQVLFEYGFDTTYGQTVELPSNPLLAGSGDLNVSVLLRSLVRGKKYHYRLVATNAGGTSYGSDITVRIALDSENDGIEDDLDFDDDNDGIPDLYDKFPLNGNESVDTDGDGIGDNEDTDDDNDGVPDAQDAFPLDPNESVDTDGDGIGDNSDPEPLVPLDTDADGNPDFSDPDDDNDGVIDFQDAFPLDSTEFADTDFDGIGNNADTDDDGDGVSDASDAFPLNPLEWIDSDGDGIGDNSDAFPNDATESHDTDGDGIGDHADPDADGDGVLNESDAFPLDSAESVDSDGDGVGDKADLWPNDPNEALDTDSDGIGDHADLDADNDGILDVYDAFPLDPNSKLDTDHDGYPDEIDQFPRNPLEHNDNDFDGIGDNYDPDDDNDGIPDVDDLYPFSPTQSPLVLSKGYQFNRDTNTFLLMDLKQDALLNSQNLTFELLTPVPPGINWNPETGVFSGVVPVASKYVIQAIVSDGAFTIHVYYYVNIVEPVVNPVFTNYEINGVMNGITLLKAPGSLELGQTDSITIQIPLGSASTVQFFTDYRPDYSGFGLMSGQIPSGMNLNPNTGVLSGTPTEATTTTSVVYLLSWKGWAYQEVNLVVSE